MGRQVARTGHPVLLDRAWNSLLKGNIAAAADDLGIYSDDTVGNPVLPRKYHQARAILSFLDGHPDDAKGRIKDAGGLTEEFFLSFKKTLISLDERPLPFRASARRSRDWMLLYCGYELTKLGEDLGMDDRLLHAIYEEVLDAQPGRSRRYLVL